MLIFCYKRLFLFCCFLFCISAQSQNIQQNRLDSFSGKLITAIRAHARPRAFLTTDKSIFRAGETIWFKASLLNSVSQKVITKSKYLFVDLVNENDSVIKSVLLDAAHQQLNAKIILPDAIPAGYYWLRAYTRQMAEGDTDNCAVKSIYVFNPKPGADIKMPTSKAMINKPEPIPIINFYPEGGSVITGANSTVAFRIHDKGERPIAVEGFIKDNHDSIIARFTSGKSGLGKFTFSPSRYRQYKAYITWNGKEINYPLPGFNFNAAQLSVTNQQGGNRLVRVLLEDSIYSKDFLTYIVGISKDSFCFASIGRGQYEVSVPDEKFPEGIATIYLFDNNFNLLSERSIYVRENNLIIKAAVDKDSYAKKSKVTFTISMTDKNQQLVPSLFSVAVIDSLFSDLSDLCGLPYFNETNKQTIINNMSVANMPCLTDEEIDLMMLLRNNTYKTIGTNLIKSSPVVDADSLLHIKGTVSNEKNEPVVNKIVTLFSKSGNGVYDTDTTDTNGRFYFEVEGYGDSTEFSVSVKNLNGRNQQIKILPDPLNFPVFKTPVYLKQHYLPEPIIAKYSSAYMETEFANTGKQRLPVVTVIGKRVLNYDVSKRVSQYSSILTSDDIGEGSSSVGNAILKIAGLHLLNGYLVFGGPTIMSAPDPTSEPLILVDGSPVALSTGIVGADVSPAMAYLNSLNGKEIDFIEVLKGAEGANYGVRGGHGVILINMASKPHDKLKAGENNANIFYAKGISNPSLFPVVNYDSKEKTSTPNFDNRSTIFWDGSVLTGTSNNITFSFFTSDIPATYKVIINGITVHGDIVYKTLTFQSK